VVDPVRIVIDPGVGMGVELDQRHWPAPGFAGHYSLAVNEHVAGAYDLGPVERAPLERILEATP
jgi:hypothetical protein